MLSWKTICFTLVSLPPENLYTTVIVAWENYETTICW